MTEALSFFGLDGTTGGYLLAPEPEEVAQLALGEELGAAHLVDVKARLQQTSPSLGVVDAVSDVTDLAQTGWGVIFAETVSPAVRDALQPLCRLRRSQATRHKQAYYQEYVYYPGETKQAFLRRLHVAPSGAADPEQMPYYLLLVGDPESIPFSFQYQLDVQYAVGRIHFDTVDEYAHYAISVAAAESNPAPRREATFFGVRNPDDAPTALSASRLVAPLAERIRAAQAAQPPTSRWEISTIIGDGADKAQLGRLLGGQQTPAFLFTASHGIGFPPDDARQREQQGALVCQDWPGPTHWRRDIPQDFYLAADDVGDDVNVSGLVAFVFACFGAGTPRLDDYPQLADGSRGGLTPFERRLARPIAPHSFVARLPQRLLGHPKGSALAVVGHVERALGSSFAWESEGRTQSSVRVFEDVIGRLLRGVPLGAAVEPLNERYAELCSDLTSAVREVEQSAKIPDPRELARLWTGSIDARGYMIFGDPAVRLIAAHVPPKLAEEAPMAQVDTATREPAPSVRRSSLDESAPTDAAMPRTVLATGASRLRIEVDTQTGRITVTTSGAAPDAPDEVSGEDSPGEIAYGLFGGQAGQKLVDLRSSLADGLKSAADQLTGALGQLMSEASTLEVTTYSSEDLDEVEYDARAERFAGKVRRRALTRMRLDGNTVAVIPEQGGKVDEQFWAAHCQLVERAQAQRAELATAIVAAATSLVGALKTM